jgi:hypothetical protein
MLPLTVEVCERILSFKRQINLARVPDEPLNICYRARQQCRNPRLVRQTHSATLRIRSENRPLSSCTSGEDVADVTSRCLVSIRKHHSCYCFHAGWDASPETAEGIIFPGGEQS